MSIRLAAAADISVMTALEQHAPTAAHWSAEQYESLFCKPGPVRVALVVEDESQVQGFLIARIVDVEWEIENIVIAGPLRGRGLGELLLSDLVRRSRVEGAEAIFLEVRESNLAARALYQKCSFVETSRRRHYYQDSNEDAISYRLGVSQRCT